jgi:hypothetical protein
MPRTMRQHRVDADDQKTAIGEFICGLYADGDYSACRAALAILASTQGSWCQQILLAAPALRSVLQ